MIEPRARPGSEPPTPADVVPGEAATLRAAQATLAGEARRLRALSPFLGPSFVAAVAYIDPGNFAAGARFGYLLVWVVIAASLMAMLAQTLSAKLGVAAGLLGQIAFG